MNKRKLKKQLKNSLIIFNLATLPSGWDMEMWWRVVRENGLIIWDSFAEGKYGASMGKLAGSVNGSAPRIVNINTRIKKLQAVDLKGKKI